MRLALQLVLVQTASGLVCGPIFARRLVRSLPPAMAELERDAEGYIKEDALGDWTKLKKSTALGATVTEWRDLPESVQPIVTALREKPESVEFDAVISAIDAGYDMTEVEFEVNGLKSAPGTNVGSAKLLSFGVLAGLSKEETLALFGQYYRDVVANPSGDDHPNIRNFMEAGWDGVSFPWGLMLSPKAAPGISEDGGLSAQTASVADALAASAQIGEDDEWDPDSEIWIP
mmetsp:Transcript_22441/g.45813  ORF Transcript_22441/g.45813 Transcript_22441/m.45813 type:complete len:231 (+) Transcript_22441:36-728(+)